MTTLYNLPSVIILYICKFLDLKDLLSFRQTATFINNNLKMLKINNIPICPNAKEKILCLNISDLKISIPDSVKVLKVNNYEHLCIINLTTNINTIIIENLNYKHNNLELLNVENLHIKKLIFPNQRYGEIIDLLALDKVNTLYIPTITSVFLPSNVKKIYCDIFNSLRKSIYLDYLECNEVYMNNCSYIKTIKINSYTGTFHICKCDKLILKKNNELIISMTKIKPEIILEN